MIRAAARIGVRVLLGDARWSPAEGLRREPSAVVVDASGSAVAYGARETILAAHPALPREEGGGVLMPGLVDCHAHLELAALAGRVPGGDGIGPWVGRLVRARADFPAAELEAYALEAARGMRALGTVAVADVCTLLATARVLREAGLLGVSLLEVVGASGEAADEALAGARARLASVPPGQLVDVRIVPHSGYGTHAKAFDALHSVNGVRSVHAAESPDEEAWLTAGEGAFAPFLRSKGAVPPGLRALPYLDSLGALGRETLLVHLVTALPGELAAARARGATAVLCPRSNLHVGGALPDLRAIRAAGLPLALGTDSLASTPDHDLLAEAKALRDAFPDVPAHELLEAATVGGARALGLAVHPWVRVDAARVLPLVDGAARAGGGAR